MASAVHKTPLLRGDHDDDKAVELDDFDVEPPKSSFEEVSLDSSSSASSSESSSHGPEPPAGLYRGAAKAVILMTSFVDILGFALPNPILPFYYSTLPGYTPQNAGLIFGLIMTAFSCGQFVGALFAGVASDKYGRRLPILVCLGGNAAFFVYTAFAPNVVHLIIARGLAGLFAGTQGVCSAYVMDLTPPEERSRELAHLSASISIGFLAGPAIGIAIGLAFGMPHVRAAFATACLAASLVGVLALIMGIFILRESSDILKEHGITLSSSSAETKNASSLSVIVSLFSKRDVALVMIDMFLNSFLSCCMEATLPLLLVQEQKCPIWQVLAVFATVALGTPPIAGFVYPWMAKQFGNKATMIVGSLICGCGLFLIPVFLVWYIQSIVMLLFAFQAVTDPALQAIASFNAGRSFGTVMGMLRSVGAAGRIIGPFLAGWLYDIDFGAFIGRHRLLPFWTGTVCCILSAIICIFMKRTEGVSSVPPEQEKLV